MAVAAGGLGAFHKGWAPLEARCVYPTAGRGDEAGRAADCASVVRPWVANDTGGVPMSVKSQDEHNVLHSWANRECWTGFRRLGTSDGASPPADWRTGVVHPQGPAYAFFGEPFTTSSETDVARPCKSAFSFNEAPGASTVSTGCNARPSLGEAQLRRVTDYGYPPCGTEPAAFLQLPAAALCFAALAAAALATFVAAAALPATIGSSAVAVAAIAPATVASAWSRRLCLVLLLLQASGVQAQTACMCINCGASVDSGITTGQCGPATGTCSSSVSNPGCWTDCATNC
eukprot:scaffold38695_cov63-Phaeocystis_antarctica.AAC.1